MEGGRARVKMPSNWQNMPISKYFFLGLSMLYSASYLLQTMYS